MRLIAGFVAGVALLSGCVPTGAPVVSDFNGDSVKVQTNGFIPMQQQRAQADPEALRICRAGGKARAEHASYIANQQTYVNTHLYLCLG